MLLQAGTWAATLLSASQDLKQHAAVDTALYQKRAALMASTVTAWSPPFQTPRGKAVLLAVGTKLGHMWLWRCHAGARLPPDAGPSLFELVSLVLLRVICTLQMPSDSIPACPSHSAPLPSAFWEDKVCLGASEVRAHARARIGTRERFQVH